MFQTENPIYMLRYILFLFLISSISHAQYSGIVFHDLNQNGQQETNEPGINAVKVSNGEKVVITDDLGAFTLPLSSRDQFIFITTPSGYRTSQFYLPNHGSAQDYHFALTETPVSDTFSFIHISDTETYDSTHWVQMLKDYSFYQQPAFIVHTGDICYVEGMKFHAAHVNDSTMGLPVHYSVGNHDLVEGDYGEQLFEELFGPVYYSFEVGNIHFIVTPMLSGDYTPQYTKEDVYRWLKNDLDQIDPGQPIMIFNHDLLRTDEGFIYRINEHEAIDLESYNLKAWVYGHWHNHFYRPHPNSDVISICTAPPNMGGIDHSPAAFRVFAVSSDGSFTTEMIHSYVDHQLVISSPAPSTQLTKKGDITVMVNAYNSTAPAKKISFRLEQGESTSLKQVSNWTWMSHTSYRDVWADRDSLHISVQGNFADGVQIERNRRFAVMPFDNKPATESWPNFLMNPQRNPSETHSINPPLQLDWVTNVGSNIYHASPIVAKGKLFIASFDDGDAQNCYVYAYDTQNGELVWKTHTRNSVKHTLAYEEGMIVAADQIGYVYAFNAETGKLDWEHDLKLNVLPSYVSGVLINDKVVYAGDGKQFSAMQLENGKVLWKNDKWPQGEGSPSPPSIGDSVVVAGSNWRHLYAFNAYTGKPLWNKTEHGLRFRNSAPVYHQGFFYTTARSSLFKIAPKTGKVVLMSETDYNLNTSSAPAITDELFIIGTADSGIRAFDIRTFEEVWHFETQSALTPSAPYSKPRVKTVAASPVISGKNLYVGGLDGIFYCLEVETGDLIWSIELGAPIFSTVAIVNDHIYVSDLGGNVYKFRTKD